MWLQVTKWLSFLGYKTHHLNPFDDIMGYHGVTHLGDPPNDVLQTIINGIGFCWHLIKWCWFQSITLYKLRLMLIVSGAFSGRLKWYTPTLFRTGSPSMRGKDDFNRIAACGPAPCSMMVSIDKRNSAKLPVKNSCVEISLIPHRSHHSPSHFPTISQPFPEPSHLQSLNELGIPQRLYTELRCQAVVHAPRFGLVLMPGQGCRDLHGSCGTTWTTQPEHP